MNAKVDSHAEVKRLDSMADKYATPKALGPDGKQMEFIMDAVLPNCRRGKVLELGYGSGHWTGRLVKEGFEVTVVEGSKALADQCRRRFGKVVNVEHSLFERFHPKSMYNNIICSCVLEHVQDTKVFLRRLNKWLSPGGVLHVVVPNALSLHRRVGLSMGLLRHPLQLSPQEIEVGHKRAYTRKILKCQIEGSGLRVRFIKGIFVKPLSSSQMIKWPSELFEAYNDLSDELPEYTAFLYGNCRKI